MRNKIKCPFCGYEMPITFSKGAECEGIFVKCKGKKCKKEFEIKIKKEVKLCHYVPMTYLKEKRGEKVGRWFNSY